MIPLIKDFFTVKSVAVRAFRLTLVTLGVAAASGQLPIPEAWEWIGYLLTTVGSTITGRDAPKATVAAAPR